MNDTEICYQKSLDLLLKNRIAEGFTASSSTPHYSAIWARDACISSIGANLTGSKDLIATSKNTLITLSRLQAMHGQIPSVYWPYRSYWDWGEVGATDSTAWFIIAAWQFYKTTGDKDLLHETYNSIRQAYVWLTFQDASNFGLIETQEGADWMDSTLNRSGKVMYVNSLFYSASIAMQELATEMSDKTLNINSDELSYKFNLLFWPAKDSNYVDLLRQVNYPSDKKEFPHPCSLSAFNEAKINRRYYISNFTYGKFVNVCDVLGNCMAIITGLADPMKEQRIHNYFEEEKIALPYPSKCLAEPIKPESDYWGLLKLPAEKHQSKEWRNPPFCYHNAAVWPFIGGFYTLAMQKSGNNGVTHLLEKLAGVNKLGPGDWMFYEWINSKTSETGGAAFQSWNAAMYIVAYKCVDKNAKFIGDKVFPSKIR